MQERTAAFLVELANRRADGWRGLLPAAARRLVQLRYRPDRRLAVYGSLAPGRSNHHELAQIRGEWERGIVYGRLEDRGWGSSIGYPALRWDPRGEPVEVWVLTSPGLPEHWPRLDEFEGDEYDRRAVPVYRDGVLVLVAHCYLAR